MRFLSRLLMMVSVIAALMVMGCGEAAKTAAPAKIEAKSQTELAKEAGVKLIHFDDVKKIVGTGVWDKAKGTLIDARPAKVYDKGHIPTAFLLSDTAIDQYYPEFLKLGLAKDDYIVTYCGGLKCEKSLIVAKYLKSQGYTNVEMYLDGQPDWSSKSYADISMDTAKSYFDKGKAIFIDARPEKIFAKKTIPGSVNIPDTKFDEHVKDLPTNKDEIIIAYCGGYKCEKSHYVAQRMYDMGYKKVVTYSGGLPEWVAAGYSTVKGGEANPNAVTTAPAACTDGLPVGDEAGIIKTDYFINNIINPDMRPANVTIVDVRNANETADGMFPGAVNVNSKDTKKGCEAFMAELPQLGYVVFHCASGGRAMETYDFVQSCKPANPQRFYYLDAYVNCSGGKCAVKE